MISPSAAASAPESPGAAAVVAAEAVGAPGAAAGASLASPLHAPLQLAPLEVALLDCEVRPRPTPYPLPLTPAPYPYALPLTRCLRSPVWRTSPMSSRLGLRVGVGVG